MDFEKQTLIYRCIFVTFIYLTECVNSARLDLLRVIDSDCQQGIKLGRGCRRDRRRNLPQVLNYKIRRNATSVVLRVIDSDHQQSHRYRRGCRRDRRRSVSYFIDYRRTKLQRWKNVNTFFRLVFEIQMQRYFNTIPLESPRLIYLFNCIFIQSTHQVEGSAEGAGFGIGETYNYFKKDNYDNIIITVDI